MAEKDADISKALAARPDRRKKRKSKLDLVEIHIETPADTVGFEGGRIIDEIDTTPDDTVIKNLGPGVDIVEPAESSSIVLEEKRYKIRRGSENPLLPG